MYYVYIIQSVPTGRYYIGSTENWQQRLRDHNLRRARFTKAYVPWTLVRLEVFEARADARKRELEIKSYRGGRAFKRLVLESLD